MSIFMLLLSAGILFVGAISMLSIFNFRFYSPDASNIQRAELNIILTRVNIDIKQKSIIKHLF